MTSPKHVICEDAIEVKSENVEFNNEYIESTYDYSTTKITRNGNTIIATPVSQVYNFRTKRNVGKVGVMIVGIGGNNGTTVTGAILANKHNLTWETKDGTMKPNYFGSLTQSTTTLLGMEQNQEIYVGLNKLLPMVNPNDLVIAGWDISNLNLYESMKRAKVFDYNLQQKLKPYMENIKPLKSIYYSDFLAGNQSSRANNVYNGNHACTEHLNILRNDIKNFKESNNLDKVIVIWSANTERMCQYKDEHETEKSLLEAIESKEEEISMSQMFAVAAILEGCSYINGSPQNTFCNGIMEMARKRGVFIGGDDFKSGQTKIKSCLMDFLVSSGLKPESIVSYNHLGNNDGKNLSEAKQFESKKISKSGVVDDMVTSNNILYSKENEKPDHCVVIKYVPFVGDSKRAMDEYTSKIFMNGLNTIVLHNTCEDSLLAAPIILDLIILTELFERIEWKLEHEHAKCYKTFESVLSVLSFLLKAPLVAKDAPLVNAFFKQRGSIENILRACIGLRPINNMLLEYKTGFYNLYKTEEVEVNVKNSTKSMPKLLNKNKDINVNTIVNEQQMVDID